MINRKSLAVLAGLIFISRLVYAEERLYPVESGIIQYSTQGLMNNEETVYFKDWGRRQARYITISDELLGSSKSLWIVDSQWTYNINLDKNTATKTRTVFRSTQEMMRKNGATKAGTEMVAGQRCDIWELQSEDGIRMRHWSWKGLEMKTEFINAANENHTVIKVTKLDLTAEVPKDKFTVPKNITIVEADVAAQ